MENSFGKALIFLRKTKYLSQVGLSKKLNVTQSQISFYESGKSDIGLRQLEKIVNILNYDLVLFMIIAKDFSQSKPLLTIEQYLSIAEASVIQENKIIRTFIKPE